MNHRSSRIDEPAPRRRIRFAIIGMLGMSGCALSPESHRPATSDLSSASIVSCVNEFASATSRSRSTNHAKPPAGVSDVANAEDIDPIRPVRWQAPTDKSANSGTEFSPSLIEATSPWIEEDPSPGDAVTPTSEPLAPAIPLNLPSALAMIDDQHPIVGQARWRVRQAYARWEQANALWLPSIQAGFSFHRHDGNYQASNGQIVDVNRNSFQYGLGAGATGAGTTNSRPGIVARFHLADAIFRPAIAEKNAWASGHAAGATLNTRLREAADAYLRLLQAHQDWEVLKKSRERFASLATITTDFAEAGEGLRSDADRLQTELALIDGRLIAAEEQTAIAAADLAQAVSLDGEGQIVPTDVQVVPLDLGTGQIDAAALVATALRSRPELKESQALVAAACEAYQREKYAPWVPSVLLGYSTGGFGGGLGNELDNVDGRYDLDAILTWETRNLGYGERAARRLQSARVQEARFAKLQVMDSIAREVRQADAQVRFRRRQMETTKRAIRFAEDSHRRNLDRIRDGQGLPLEALQSVQALEAAKRAYLSAVIDHNRAQIRLQWALGFPLG